MDDNARTRRLLLATIVQRIECSCIVVTSSLEIKEIET